MAFADHFPGFRLRMTRWGIAYLAACVVLGLAAVNTGNNALMAMLALALASYVVSGMWSRQVLGSLEARIRPPKDLFADRPAMVEIELSNTSRIFPAYGLTVRDNEGRLLLGEPLLERRGCNRHSVEVVFPKRGWHDLGPWRLEVVMPLGFFVKSKILACDRQVLVYPRLLPKSGMAVRRGGGRRAPDALESRGREGDVTQLRTYREGDELRAMHWKQTARQQTLVVVERQRTGETPVFFVIDPRLADPDDTAQLAHFERLVSEAATGAVQRLREGVSVGLVVGDVVVRPVRSPYRAPALLRPLAEVEARPLSDPAPAKVSVGRRMAFSASGGAR